LFNCTVTGYDVLDAVLTKRFEGEADLVPQLP
jgi:hypothetical protein